MKGETCLTPVSMAKSSVWPSWCSSWGGSAVTWRLRWIFVGHGTGGGCSKAKTTSTHKSAFHNYRIEESEAERTRPKPSSQNRYCFLLIFFYKAEEKCFWIDSGPFFITLYGCTGGGGGQRFPKMKEVKSRQVSLRLICTFPGNQQSFLESQFVFLCFFQLDKNKVRKA